MTFAPLSPAASLVTLSALAARAGLSGTAVAGARSSAQSADGNGFAAVLAARRGDRSAAATAVTPVRAPGRNVALADPEAAYRMMGEINRRHVVHRAELSVMQKLGADVRGLGDEARRLAQVTLGGSDEAVVQALAGFAERYNAWRRDYDEQVAPGGLLAGTQAARVARWEFARSLDNVFHGAQSGVRGMAAIGLTLRRGDDTAQLDAGALRAALARQPEAVRATLRDCAADLARCADLLNAPRNFIPNRLDNLNRAIAWIDANLPSLQAEFGLGDPYRLPSVPSAPVVPA